MHPIRWFPQRLGIKIELRRNTVNTPQSLPQNTGVTLEISISSPRCSEDKRGFWLFGGWILNSLIPYVPEETKSEFPFIFTIFSGHALFHPIIIFFYNSKFLCSRFRRYNLNQRRTYKHCYRRPKQV